MAIYCKKAAEWQREWLENFEAETGFEPKHQDDLDTGEMSFIEVATENLVWLENWMKDTYLSVLSFPDEYVNAGRRNLMGRRANG